jgi:hypothetical protein
MIIHIQIDRLNIAVRVLFKLFISRIKCVIYVTVAKRLSVSS